MSAARRCLFLQDDGVVLECDRQVKSGPSVVPPYRLRPHPFRDWVQHYLSARQRHPARERLPRLVTRPPPHVHRRILGVPRVRHGHAPLRAGLILPAEHDDRLRVVHAEAVRGQQRVLARAQVRAPAEQQVSLAQRRRQPHAQALPDRPQHILAVPVAGCQRPRPGRGELGDEIPRPLPIPEPGTHRPADVEAPDHDRKPNRPLPPAARSPCLHIATDAPGRYPGQRRRLLAQRRPPQCHS